MPSATEMQSSSNWNDSITLNSKGGWVVWAKVKGHSWWPAVCFNNVKALLSSGYDYPDPNKLISKSKRMVVFFSTYEVNELTAKDGVIEDFVLSYNKIEPKISSLKLPKIKAMKYLEALLEAKQMAQQNAMKPGSFYYDELDMKEWEYATKLEKLCKCSEFAKADVSLFLDIVTSTLNPNHSTYPIWFNLKREMQNQELDLKNITSMAKPLFNLKPPSKKEKVDKNVLACQQPVVLVGGRKRTNKTSAFKLKANSEQKSKKIKVSKPRQMATIALKKKKEKIKQANKLLISPNQNLDKKTTKKIKQLSRGQLLAKKKKQLQINQQKVQVSCKKISSNRPQKISVEKIINKRRCQSVDSLVPVKKKKITKTKAKKIYKLKFSSNHKDFNQLEVNSQLKEKKDNVNQDNDAVVYEKTMHSDDTHIEMSLDMSAPTPLSSIWRSGAIDTLSYASSSIHCSSLSIEQLSSQMHGCHLNNALVWDDAIFTDASDDDQNKSEEITRSNRKRSIGRQRNCHHLNLKNDLARGGLDPHILVNCGHYDHSATKQPFDIRIHPDATFICDLHAHLAEIEIIGFLGGKWDMEKRIIYIQAAFPCRSLQTNGYDGSTDVEMDPGSEIELRNIITKQNLQVVGWYHSHPTFQPDPSIRDIENQSSYQCLFKHDKSSAEPFVGLIVGTFDSKNNTNRSIFRYFHVQREKMTGNRQVELPMELNLKERVYRRKKRGAQLKQVSTASTSNHNHKNQEEEKYYKDSMMIYPSVWESLGYNLNNHKTNISSTYTIQQYQSSPSSDPSAKCNDDDDNNNNNDNEMDMDRINKSSLCDEMITDKEMESTQEEMMNSNPLFMDEDEEDFYQVSSLKTNNASISITTTIEEKKKEIMIIKENFYSMDDNIKKKLYEKYGKGMNGLIEQAVALIIYYSQYDKRVIIDDKWKGKITKLQRIQSSLYESTSGIDLDEEERNAFIHDLVEYIQISWKSKSKGYME